MSADDAHLSTDELADLGAELLTPDRVAAALAHLRSCATCRTTQDLLAGVPALLAGVAPSPIPAEVTARVVAAIEREQIARAGDADGRPATDTARSRSQRAGFRRRFGARIGAGLLGATAVLGGGYLVLNGVLGDGGSDSPSSAGSAETLEESPLADGPMITDSADAVDYTAASLDQDVLRLLTLAPSGPEAERTPRDTGVMGDDGGVGEPDDARTKACVGATQRIAGSEADPLAVDIGTYEGLPAVVIVLPEGTSGTAPLDVWVVSASCVDADQAAVPRLSASLEVLRHQTVRR